MKKTILATLAMGMALEAPAAAETGAAFVACANQEAARSDAQVETDSIGYAAMTCVRRYPGSARKWCDLMVGEASAPTIPPAVRLAPSAA